MGYNETLDQWKQILVTLDTDYIDLLLIHWPGPSENSTDPACVGPKATPKVRRCAGPGVTPAPGHAPHAGHPVPSPHLAFRRAGLPPVDMASGGGHLPRRQRPRHWRVQL